MRVWLISAIRLAIHVGALGGLWVAPPTPARLAVLAVAYVTGMLAVVVGYHRYFAHRTFKVGRPVQLLMALAATSTLQRGVIWWAAIHRRHHAEVDGPGDPHSPADGVYHAHLGWLTRPDVLGQPFDHVADLTEYPELRFLEKGYVLVALGWAAGCVVAGLALDRFAPGLGLGPVPMVVWGFAWRTLLVWHGTFSINSFAHLVGTRRYDTPDTSRNNALLSAISLGEGWHNNHHRAPGAASSGHAWWEIDPAYRTIRVMEALGLAWGVRPIPPRVLEEGRL
ncbi:MAG: acyl-CoA desaturase [Myxococcota bacterium]